MDITQYVTARDASEMLECTSHQIRFLCNQGKLPGAIKKGYSWLIPRESVENYKPGKKGFAVVWERRKKESGELSAKDIRGIIEGSAKNGGVIEADQEGGRE